MLLVYMKQMWALDQYQYFPFVFVVVGALLYKRFPGIFRPPANWYRWTQIALAMLMVAGSILVRSPWLTGVGFVLLASSFLGSNFGRDGRVLSPLILPLIMLIRLPLGYDKLLVIRLQSITTDLSSVMLDIIGIPHDASANIIRLANKELFVAEACSGIQSVFTLAFIAIALVTLLNRRIWLAPVYILIAIFLAVAANVMRVTSVAVGQAWYGVDLSEGWLHDLIGYVALLVAVLFLLSFDQLVMTLLHPVDPAEDESVPNPLITAWNWLVSSEDQQKSDQAAERLPQSFSFELAPPMIRIGFVLLIGLVSLGGAAQATRLTFFNDAANLAPARAMVMATSSELLESPSYQHISVGNHQVNRGGSNERLGDNADLWEFQLDEITGQLVLSQPYRGWHELCICYEIRDWILINRQVAFPNPDITDSDDPSDFPIAFARLKSGNNFGYLMYTCVGSNGDVIQPPPKPGRLGTRFDDLVYSGDAYDRDDLMMLQLWVVSDKKLSLPQIAALKTDFLVARQTVVDAAKHNNAHSSGELEANSGDQQEGSR